MAAVGNIDFQADPYQGDPREVALLPRYCPYTQLFRERVPGGNDPGEINRWNRLLGETFQHMHHWCAGLVRANRALIFSSGNRTYNLEEALREFEYVIRRSSVDFVLLPELLTKKGEILFLVDRPTEGASALLRAMELKPDYWPPYATLSDYFKKIKDIGQARSWLEKGLAAVPNAQALQRRLTELGAGKPK